MAYLDEENGDDNDEITNSGLPDKLRGISLKGISYQANRMTFNDVKKLTFSPSDINREDLRACVNTSSIHIHSTLNFFLFRLACLSGESTLIVDSMRLLPTNKFTGYVLRYLKGLDLSPLFEISLKDPLNFSRTIYFLTHLASASSQAIGQVSLILEQNPQRYDLFEDFSLVIKDFEDTQMSQFIQRISKRSSSNAIDLCSLLIRLGVKSSIAFDYLKGILASENDENREKASKAILSQSSHEIDTKAVDDLLKNGLSKNFKIRNSILKAIARCKWVLSSTALDLLVPLLEKENNEETLGFLFDILLNSGYDSRNWISKKISGMRPSLKISLVKSCLYSKKGGLVSSAFKLLLDEGNLGHQLALLLTALFIQGNSLEGALILFKRYFALPNGPFGDAHLESADPLASVLVLQNFYLKRIPGIQYDPQLLGYLHAAFCYFACGNKLDDPDSKKELIRASRREFAFSVEFLQFLLSKSNFNVHLIHLASLHVEPSASNLILMANLGHAVFTKFIRLFNNCISPLEIISKLDQCKNKELILNWLAGSDPQGLFDCLVSSLDSDFKFSSLAFGFLKESSIDSSVKSRSMPLILEYLRSVELQGIPPEEARKVYGLLNLFGLNLPFSLLLSFAGNFSAIDRNWYISDDPAQMFESSKKALLEHPLTGPSFWILYWLNRLHPIVEESIFNSSEIASIISGVPLSVGDPLTFYYLLEFLVSSVEKCPLATPVAIDFINRSSLDKKIEAFPFLSEFIVRFAVDENRCCRQISNYAVQNLLQVPDKLKNVQFFLDFEFRGDSKACVIKEKLSEIKPPSNALESYGKALASIFDPHLFDFLFDIFLGNRLPEGPKQRIKPGTDLTLNARKSVAYALRFLPSIEVDFVQGFLLNKAFLDPNEAVASEFLTSFTKLLDKIDNVRDILPLFEKSMQNKLHPSNDSDRLESYLMVCLSELTLKVFYDPSPESYGKRNALCENLWERLSNAKSEKVQKSIADALGSILRIGDLSKYECLPTLLERAMTSLGDSKNSLPIGVKRGSAFGLGAICAVGGLKFISLHQFVPQFIKWLTEGGIHQKIGALFAIEMISFYLGPLFEPFAILLAPFIMAGFGGTTGSLGEDLRAASSDTAMQLIASSLSSIHGVKLLLPHLLSELETSTSWRSRVAAIEWLGQMSSINRISLASYLPQIVPALVQHGLIDAHPQVQKSAKLALMQYGRSIRSPEIQKLFPIVLEAMGDPEKCLNSALGGNSKHQLFPCC